MSDGSIFERIAFRIGGDLNHLLEVGMFLVVAIFAVASITEISARDSYLGYLQNEINSINQELAQNSGGVSDKFTDEAISSLKKQAQFYGQLRGKVEALISVGADRQSQTLVEIRREFDDANSFGQSDESIGYTSILYMLQRYITQLSSDYLLAITIMTRGAIGAGIGTIRTTSRFTWRSILFGLSSGFIVFLTIKGGKHIFLLHAQGQLIQFNPYSSGFFGLLAGMFTEKTFEFLGAVTDSVFNKLKNVLDE
ncbi:hypothetical protein ACQUQP_15125 [Marinobacterium sp. YM272]|uniref:hypothetical protein n=1 Tax=Marinobacterium sp. YM272 TaxID=3421654 RepID=UPI003D7F7F0B